jgi:hypothetical protein
MIALLSEVGITPPLVMSWVQTLVPACCRTTMLPDAALKCRLKPKCQLRRIWIASHGRCRPAPSLVSPSKAIVRRCCDIRAEMFDAKNVQTSPGCLLVTSFCYSAWLPLI